MPTVAVPSQPIAGCSPSSVQETTIMTIWPSIAGTDIGQLLGRLFQIQAGVWVFTVGNLLALLSIPLVLPLILNKFILSVLAGIPVIGIPFLPFKSAIKRYVLTNRRVIIAEGMIPKTAQYVEFDRFDAIDIVIRPGQEWYPAGDLIFRKGNSESFRLVGVRRPETFKQTVMKTRNVFVGIKKAQG